MRIIQVVESLDMGGLERLAVNLAIEQKRRGDDPKIYCVCRRGMLADEAEAAGIPVRCFNKPRGPNPFAFIRLAHAFLSECPDVVHTHNANIHHYGALAAKLARVPVIINTRHTPLSPPTLMYRERHFRWARHFTDFLVFVSREARDSILDGLSLERSRTAVVSTAIPFDIHSANPASPLSLPTRLRFGSLGRMVSQKGYDLLVDAFALVLSDLPTAELRIAGDGPLLRALIERVSALGIGERISFIGPTKEPAAFLRELDVFVLPSRFEGMPLALLEAMAAGLPVVATRVGGIPECIPEDIGWLCPPEDKEELAHAMISAARSSDILSRAAAGKALVLRNHSIAAMCDRYYEIFDVLASKSE